MMLPLGPLATPSPRPPLSPHTSSLALHNLAMVLAHLFSCGLVRADVLYGYLGLLRNRLDEPDVDVIVTILGSVGLQLRGDDPMAMKEFVVGVHSKAAERGQQGEQLTVGLGELCLRGQAQGLHCHPPVGLVPPQRWIEQEGTDDVGPRG